MSDPTINRPTGIDVSKYQRRVDWSAVRASGRSFGFARAIDDATGTTADPFFVRNYQGMRDAGILRGAYHFFNPRRNARAAANLFVSIVGALRPGDLQPVIDVESDGSRRNRQGVITRQRLPASVILDGVAQWIDIVEAALGRQVIIYTFPAFWINSLGNSRRFSDHPLWIAHLTQRPTVPSAFRTFSFHQHSFTGRVPGVNGNVDLNRFNGSVNGLRAFAGLPRLLAVAPDADASVEPLVVSTMRATTQVSSANSSRTSATKAAATKKRGTKKGAAKKGAAKKATARKATARKAAAKGAGKKRLPAQKTSAKKAAKRGSKKARQS